VTITNIEEIVINGSSGADALIGSSGNDTLNGDAGDDVLVGAAGADALNGGDGIDTASYAEASAGVIIDLTRTFLDWTGDAQGDSFSSIERYFLTGFNDLFIGDGNANAVDGGDGNDRLIGLGGDDSLAGNTGNDLLEGGDGNDTLLGDFADSELPPGNDILFGNAGDDNLVGNAGDDSLDGGAGADRLEGGAGFDYAWYGDATSGVGIDLMAASSTWTGDARGDTVIGIEAFDLSNFADAFAGNDADEKVLGRDGNDQLSGRGGNDTLVGDAGNDVLTGGLGADVLAGGQGADIFEFTSIGDSSGAFVNGVQQIDDITDFMQSEDKIDLSAIDANGTLAGDQAFTFLDNPAGHTGDWTGLVWSEADGNGHTLVMVSTDGDADAEMQIYLPQPIQLHPGDFIL
jgi:serralysin